MDSPYLRVRHACHDKGREVWTLVGEVDLATIPLLRYALGEAEATHTVVNLTHVEFLDLAGARAIALAAGHARDTGRRFSVVASTTAVLRVLVASGLADGLEIHSDLREVFPPGKSGHSRGDLAPPTEEETRWRPHRPNRIRRR
ncbi:STAS domain-containing protein [Actinophytocola sp.]|uniref:STAS domain-containing protein n=1 Tax=Actinophytocola sp. TaxID=1872138 RepID=UPI002ED52FCB